MIVIKCKSGKIFAGSVKEHADAEWKIEEIYYKAQGCTIEEQESFAFDSCKCEHCESLDHDCQDLIDELRRQPALV